MKRKRIRVFDSSTGHLLVPEVWGSRMTSREILKLRIAVGAMNIVDGWSRKRATA